MKKNNIISNSEYMLSNWIKWQPRSFIYVAIRIPSMILLPAVTSFVPKMIIDCINNHVSISKMIIYISIISLIIAGLSWISPYMYEKNEGAAQLIKKKYSLLLFRKSMEVDYSILESFSGRRQLERAKEFTEGYHPASSVFCNISVLLVTNFLGIISYATILFKINILVILFIVLTCLGELAYIIFLEKIRHDCFNQESKFYVIYKYFFDLSHNISAGKDIRLYRLVNLFMNILKSVNEKHTNILNKFTQQSAKVSLVRGLLSMIREALAYMYLTYLVSNRDISVSEFVFYFGIVTGFSAWLIGLAEQYKDLLNCSECCSHYREFLNHCSNEDNKYTSSKEIISTPPKIKISNLNFKYEGSYYNMLNNINLEINPGENIALVGKNGAGKTTFIKLLIGLYNIPSNTIYFDGIDVSTMSNNLYNTYFSTIFQDYYFLPMSIEENICLCDAKDIDYDRLMTCLRYSGMHEKILSLPSGLKSKMIKKVFKDAVDFSGGEKQKLLLARALYRNSPILILDEPTASLDSIAEMELYNQYKEFSKGKTSIFISHRLSSTIFCDKIIYLEDGKIMESGTHKELMDLKGQYYKMFMTQSYYYQERLCKE